MRVLAYVCLRLCMSACLCVCLYCLRALVHVNILSARLHAVQGQKHIGGLHYNHPEAGKVSGVDQRVTHKIQANRPTPLGQ